jgi:hypothetical protein
VSELGLLRFLLKTGKYREGDEGRGEVEGVFDDFAALVDAILAAKKG